MRTGNYFVAATYHIKQCPPSRQLNSTRPKNMKFETCRKKKNKSYTVKHIMSSLAPLNMIINGNELLGFIKAATE